MKISLDTVQDSSHIHFDDTPRFISCELKGGKIPPGAAPIRDDMATWKKVTINFDDGKDISFITNMADEDVPDCILRWISSAHKCTSGSNVTFLKPEDVHNLLHDDSKEVKEKYGDKS